MIETLVQIIDNFLNKMEEALGIIDHPDFKNRIPENKYLELRTAIASAAKQYLKSGVITAEINSDQLIVTWHDRHGLPHRECNPAVIVYNHDGHIQSQQWYHHGRLDRPD